MRPTGPGQGAGHPVRVGGRATRLHRPALTGQAGPCADRPRAGKQHRARPRAGHPPARSVHRCPARLRALPQQECRRQDHRQCVRAALGQLLRAAGADHRDAVQPGHAGVLHHRLDAVSGPPPQEARGTCLTPASRGGHRHRAAVAGGVCQPEWFCRTAGLAHGGAVAGGWPAGARPAARAGGCGVARGYGESLVRHQYVRRWRSAGCGACVRATGIGAVHLAAGPGVRRAWARRPRVHTLLRFLAAGGQLAGGAGRAATVRQHRGGPHRYRATGVLASAAGRADRGCGSHPAAGTG